MLKKKKKKKKAKTKTRTKKTPKSEESWKEAKRRKMIADADKAEAVMARIKGETILVSDMQAWHARIAQAIRQPLEIIQRRYGKGAVDLIRAALLDAEQEFKRGRPAIMKTGQGKGVYGQRSILSKKNTGLTRKRRKK